MSVQESRFARLMDLAKEKASDKRRDLLREVTEMFFDGQSHSGSADAMFTEIIGSVAAEMDVTVRAELARRVADAEHAPSALARRLALDEIEVASPVLQWSKALSDEDLVQIVKTRGHAHMMAVTKRETVSETVSEALVTHGDDRIVGALLRNEGAKLSDETFETVAERAEKNQALQAPLVKRKVVPLHVLNQLYMSVEANLRAEILKRNDAVSPAELERALKKAKVRVAQTMGALPQDYEEAQRWVQNQKLRNTFSPPVLVRLLREKETTKFVLSFADLCQLDFETSRRIVENNDIDSLAMCCRAAGFDRALFVTLAVLIAGGDRGFGRAEAFGQMFNEVPVDAAQRAMRFWRVRAQAEATRAA